MFKQGDVLSLNKLPNKDGEMGDFTVSLNEIFIVMDDVTLWGTRGQWAVDAATAKKGLLLRWNEGKTTLFESYFSKYIDKSISANVCTCDSLELFRKGCMCGHVKKKKWGLVG